MVKTLLCIDNKTKFIVDDRDYDIVQVFRWRYSGRTNGKGGCLTAGITLGRLLLLKRLAKRRLLDPSAQVDHVNGNVLDHRRSNLRIVSVSENNHFKWKKIALRRLRQGIKCDLKCNNLATSIVRLPSNRYLYLCDDHLVTSRRRRHAVQK